MESKWLFCCYRNITSCQKIDIDGPDKLIGTLESNREFEAEKVPLFLEKRESRSSLQIDPFFREKWNTTTCPFWIRVGGLGSYGAPKLTRPSRVDSGGLKNQIYFLSGLK